MATIRPAEPADAQAICGVHVAAIGAVDGPYDDEQVLAWASYPTPDRYPVEDAGSPLFVAEADDEVVGFAELDPTEATVDKVYVHPDHAGRGVGRALLERVESAATERGLEELSVVASLNAVPFYEAVGYERVGETTKSIAGDVDFPCVLLERGLE